MTLLQRAAEPKTNMSELCETCEGGGYVRVFGAPACPDCEYGRQRIYRVEINGRIHTVYSEESAWDAIGQAPFGSGYVVRDGNGNVREEFIPY